MDPEEATRLCIEFLGLGMYEGKTHAQYYAAKDVALLIDLLESGELRIVSGKTSPPIEWSGPFEASSEVAYTHYIGVTPFGRFVVTWKGWKEDSDAGTDESPWGEVHYSGYGPDEERAWCEREYQKRLFAALPGDLRIVSGARLAALEKVAKKAFALENSTRNLGTIYREDIRAVVDALAELDALEGGDAK